MADLTWAQVAAKAPTDAIVVSAGKVMIDVSLLTGDTVDALSDEGVTEFMIKLHDACNQAQTTANAVPGATQINAFPTPSYGTPLRESNGTVASSVNSSIIGRIVVSNDAISANVL